MNLCGSQTHVMGITWAFEALRSFQISFTDTIQRKDQYAQWRMVSQGATGLFPSPDLKTLYITDTGVIHEAPLS